MGGSAFPFSTLPMESLDATADTRGMSRDFLRRRKITVARTPMKTLARIRTMPMKRPISIPGFDFALMRDQMWSAWTLCILLTGIRLVG